VATAFEKKLVKNGEKYPAEAFAGKSSKVRNRAYYQIKAKYRGGHPLADSNE